MIADTDTVINPRAVMIITFNTFIADGAMSRTAGTNDLAIWAEVGWRKLL